MKTTYIFLLLLFGGLIISCEENANPDCEEDLICTTVFKTITVTISDDSGSPALLDSIRVQNLDTSVIYSFKDSDLSPEAGTYVLLTDGQISETKASGNNFQFLGYLKGAEVVNQNYKIGHNCCHIELLTGNTEIVL